MLARGQREKEVWEKAGYRKAWKRRNKMDDEYKKFILKEEIIIKEKLHEEKLNDNKIN
jgi:hypothetical protein